MEKSLIWFDGKLIDWKDATIHIATHTLHYGSGAFEGMRCYDTASGPAIFRLEEHVDRLFNSFAVFGRQLPWDKTTIKQAIIETVKANRFKNCYIRPLIFFGAESLLLSPYNLSIHCAIIAWPMDKYLGKEAIRVAISPIKRIDPNSMPIQNKINGFYVNSILAFHEAQNRGWDEALLLDNMNNIAEGSVANVFLVIEGKLKTPPSTSILPGITRSSIITIAKNLNIAVEEETLQVPQIEAATEAFFTGTASEVTPIKQIEQKKFAHAPGIITQKLRIAYQDITQGRDYNFKSWLSFIN